MGGSSVGPGNVECACGTRGEGGYGGMVSRWCVLFIERGFVGWMFVLGVGHGGI